MYKINAHNISGARNWINNSDWKVVVTNYICMYAVVLKFICIGVFLLLVVLCSYVHIHIYIYINNWPLLLFSQDYNLSSHITYVVCVKFIHEKQNLQLKADFERQIFWATFHGNFIRAEEIFLHISFCSRYLNGGLNRSLTSNKTTHYLQNYGDFHTSIYHIEC